MTYLVTWPQYKKMARYLERWTSTEGQVKKEWRQNELKLGCVILSCSMVLLSLCRILYPKELWICFVPTKKRIKKLICGIILLIFVLSSSNWFPLPSIQETLKSLQGSGQCGCKSPIHCSLNSSGSPTLAIHWLKRKVGIAELRTIFI